MADRDESGAEGQRRYLTVLFSDLSDSTGLGGRVDAEDYAALLAELRGLYRRVVMKHGGRIARIQGDGMLAIFGYPTAEEDDGRRATEAALELHALVSELDVGQLPAALKPLRLHSGIHAGLVYLSDGDVERGRFEVLGDVPNLAARLSGLAGRGEIVVSVETLGPEASFFSTSKPRLVPLKGLATPMWTYLVEGRAPFHTRFEARAMRGLAPFAGREPEMSRLSAHLEEASTGKPQCVAIRGGPGLGKTRLLQEFLHLPSAVGCTILRGYCESYLSAEPLQPFLQMLRALLGVFPGLPPDRAAAAAEASLAKFQVLGETSRRELMQALSLVKTPEGQHPAAGGTIVALTELFAGLAVERPLMLVLDDWQWADDASQRVLDAVRALDRSIFILAATRDLGEDLLVGRFTVLNLGPLSLDAAGRTIGHLLPHGDPFFVAEIHRYAGGNPLFIEELCHSAAATGMERLGDSEHNGAAWLNALIESRVTRLPAPQAEIVSAAAVLGNVFPMWLLETITGRGAEDPLVRELAEQDFLYPTEQAAMMRFKHGITRNVVYSTLGLRHRRAMHLRVAGILAERAAQEGQDGAYEALAYHYGAGQKPAEAAKYAELAGDKAMAALALDRARIQYLAALTALDALAPLGQETCLSWCAVAQKLGMVCVYDPLGLHQGVGIFEKSVEIARQTGSVEAVARAEYWLGYVCYSRGMTRKAVTHCEAAVHLAERTADSRLAAQVAATLGQALVSASDYGRALPLLDTAIDSKRKSSKAGSSIAVGSAYTLACKGCLLGDKGLFGQAEECFGEAIKLLGSTPHQVASSVRGWISAVYQWQGRWEEARREAEEAARIAEQVHSLQLLAMSRALGGYANWTLTRRPEALQTIRDATSWMEKGNGAFFASLYYGWLVDGLVASGHTKEARRHAARLFLRARQHDRLGEAMGARALARAAAQDGDFARADRYLWRSLQSAQARDSPRERAITEFCAAEIAHARGQPQAARMPLASAIHAFEAMRMPWHLTQAELLSRKL